MEARWRLTPGASNCSRGRPNPKAPASLCPMLRGRTWERRRAATEARLLRRLRLREDCRNVVASVGEFRFGEKEECAFACTPLTVLSECCDKFVLRICHGDSWLPSKFSKAAR